jgi:transposase
MAGPKFVNIDRQSPLLLPPDLRDWLPEDDLAHFILEVVEQTDLSRAWVNTRGTGDAQYPPGMMLAVLIYCYATGTFSSRRIEALTYQHVSVRYLAGNEHPDHDSICLFRRRNEPLLQAVFAQVLKVAGTLGLGQVGTVCLDGTKILASATKRRTHNQAQLEEQARQLDLQISGLLAQAEKADQADAAAQAQDGTRLPQKLRSAQRRREQIQAALTKLQEVCAEKAQEREADRAAWRADPMGECPRARSAKPGEKDRINLSDPESALQPLPRGGYAQGYNAQAIVSAEHHALILATAVCTDTNDRQQLQPMLATLTPAQRTACQRVVVDSGYDHARQIAQLEAGQPGLEILCAPQPKSRKKKATALLAVPEEAAERLPEEGAAEAGGAAQARQRKPASPSVAVQRSRDLRARLDQKARSPEGRQWLKVRRTSVEPVFGIIKETLGFRRFSLRGLAKVNLEWQLVATAFNCRRLCAARRRQRAAQKK